MGKTAIEWTDETWNPVVGCRECSPGCKNCYAEALHTKRHKAYLAGKDVPQQYAEPFHVIQTIPDRLDKPLHWRSPRLVFVNSVSDLFHEDVPDAFILAVFDVMAACRQHTFQVLTKRAERMAWFCAHYCIALWGNVWLGVSVEDQQYADERIPLLLQTPATVRFLSCEPLLGPVDLRPYLCEWTCPGCGARTTAKTDKDLRRVHICKCGTVPWSQRHLHWVIAGGESGPKARPAHPDWFRSLRDQCKAAGVPFFFKQWGEWHPDYKTCGKSLIKMSGGVGSRGAKPGRYNIDCRGLLADGTLYDDTKPDMLLDPSYSSMYRVGKKAAGHLLDGVQHHEFPEPKGNEGNA